MNVQKQESPPREVFYIAASEDKALAAQLEKHLSILKHQNIITHLWGCEIKPDMGNLRSLDHALQHASVLLLLISPDFLASDIGNVFVRQAIKLSESGAKIILPVLLRPVAIVNAPFAHLKSIPRNGRFVTLWRNRDEAFVEIAEAMVELFDQTFPAMLKAQAAFPIGSGGFVSMQDLVNRERMLERVQTIWIKNKLEGQWLHNALLINPTLHELPDAIDDSRQSVMREEKLSESPFPDGTSIIQAYDKAEGTLLILGAPGTGKTTLLLELVRELINRAKHDEDHAIPVFLNLASWMGMRRSLAEWLVEELQSQYYLPNRIARNWVEIQQVSLLLDGLDLLPTDTLSACVDAINAYRQVHATVPLVICSRSRAYLEQRARLTLHCAVAIQPLTEQQIDRYLSSVGKLEMLRAVLMQDAALHALTTTPLILSILIQTDQKMLTGNLKEMGIEARRAALFTIYIESVLTRGEEGVFYLSSKTVSWLAWLARQMQRHYQVIFYPRRIQPDWLPEKQWSMVYYLFNALVGVLLSGAALGLVGNIVGGQSLGIVIGLVGGLVGGMGFAFAAGRIRPVETVRRLTVKRHIGSLLFSLVLWMLVLLINQSGGFSGALMTIVIMFSLPLLLIGELLKELPDALLDEAVVGSPDYDLQQSTRNAIRIGLLVGIGFGVLVILFQLLGFLKAHFVSYLLLALMLGLLSGLILGGLAVLQIKGLYWLLSRSGLVPKKYTDFLDYTVRCSLLNKVGSGYMFRYSLLQDYFATK